MMKKFYKVLSVLAIPAFLLLYSYTGGSPGGKTGSPGDGGATCTQCHAGTAQPQGGLISTTVPFSGYEPGETYTVTVSANMSGISKYGFELTAESNGGVKQGTFSVTDPARVKKVNGGKAVTHTSGGTVASGGSISWSVDWTAPAAGTGQVTFYTAVNATNSNGSTSGDQIYTGSRMVSEHVANPQITEVEPNIVTQDYVGNVVIMGEETTWLDGVSNVHFVLHSNNAVAFDAASFVVVSDIEITAEMPLLLNQQIGVYDLFVDDLMMENALTVTLVDGIADNSLSSLISVYPNPSVDYITVKGQEGATLQIVDLTGSVYQSLDNIDRMQRVEVNELSPGLYFVFITKGNQHAVKKFIVEK